MAKLFKITNALLLFKDESVARRADTSERAWFVNSTSAITTVKAVTFITACVISDKIVPII